jgi:hypothetical protein
MPIASGVKRSLWLAIPAVVGAGTLYWVLAPASGHSKARAQAVDTMEVQASGPRVVEARKLGSDRGTGGTARIVDAYAAWASDPSAVSARKLLLQRLFAEEDIATKLSGVLAAVEADQTPPERDPLWEYIATTLADLWKGEVATNGIDLMMAESRPRARRAVISSFAEVATSERLAALNADQRQTLTETMIDLTPHVPAGQKPEMDAALRKLGGNDLADIMAGKGITGKDGHVLESERAYNAALEETKKDLARQADAR